MERRDKLAHRNYWNELIALRDEQRERRRTAVQVVRGDELPQETNDYGRLRWYMHPAIDDTILSTVMFYEQELPPRSRSGRLKFQGGQVMYILAGSGYTTIDGVKHPWKAGDVLNLPIRRDGIVVQHVNDDETVAAKFLACEPNWFAATGVDRGSGFELVEPARESPRG
jgi:gentisate 1,2-dioxygenase